MFEQEEAGEVIHLDYNSEDEYKIPENETNDTNDDDDDEEEGDSGNEGESKARLMKYLLKGLVLQSTTTTTKDAAATSASL